jgi:hypothetical protein
MAWVLWLAVPVVVTLLVALWVWLRGRAPRTPSTDQAMRAHQDYLDALVVPARGSTRPGQ